MLKFERWYFKLGLIKPSNVLNPRVISGSTLFYPDYSEVYNFKVTDLPESVSRKIPIFNKQKSVFVINYTEYGSDTIGNFRKMPFNNVQYLKQLSLNEKEFRFLKPHEFTTIKIRRDTLLIRNFSPVNYHYKYPNNRFVKYWKFLNTINTVIEKINLNKSSGSDKPRYKFITIDLPNFLPRFEQLEVFSKKLTLQRLNSIPSYKYFTLLELWKFLKPELKEESIFNKINKDERPYVNFIFTCKGACSIVNMDILENLIKEYNIESSPGNNSLDTDNFLSFLNTIDVDESFYNLSIRPGLEAVKLIGKTTYKSRIFRKMFLLFLNNIINTQTVEDLPNEEVVTTNEVEVFKDAVAKHNLVNNLTDYKSNSQPEDKESKLPESESESETVITKMLSNEVPNYNNKTHEDQLLPVVEQVKEDVDTTKEMEDETIEEVFDDESVHTVLEQTLENKAYNNLEAVMNAKVEDPKDKLRKQLSSLKENGLLSNKQEKDLITILDNQNHKTSPYPELGDTKLPNLLSIDNDSEVDELKSYTVNDNKSVLDKGYNKKTIEGFDKQYIPKTMKKDMVRTVYSLQSAGLIIKDYKIERSNNILDNTEKHTIELKPLSGQPSSVSVILPRIEEDGTFKMSGNTYRMRKQRVERPIRKINPFSVVLSSYYGKIFVSKAVVKSENYGYYLFNALRKNPEISGLILGEADLKDIKFPRIYSALSRFVRMFTHNDIDYFFLGPDMMSNDDLSNYLKSNIIHVGSKFKLDKSGMKTIVGSVFMDMEGRLLLGEWNKNNVYNVNNLSTFGHILDVIGVDDLSSGPIEYGSIKVGKERVPVVLPLAYYLGLDKLISILGVKHEIIETETGRAKYSGDKPHFKLRFKNKVIFIERDFSKSDIILGGLTTIKELQEINYSSFNSKDRFGLVFSYLDLPIVQVTEIKLLEDMFVDPMTQTLLRQIKEPETFIGLLIRASELLANDEYPDQGDIEGQVIKGYERVVGMVYKTLINGIKEHECRSSFARSKLSVDPYSVLTKMKDDSTTVLLDDLNPIAEIKQKEDVSYLGEGGQKAISMTASRRATDPSVIGIMSEAHKDNSQVGITTYLTPDPNIKNVRGIVKREDVKNKSWGGILSTPALLAPFSTNDDSKRLNIWSM